jgi:5'-nucleotidase
VILHTADLHGQVDRLPSLASFIESERRKSEVSGVRVLHVDSGDFFQGTPEGDLTRGRAVLEALNAMRCDALVPGNHDFDLGPGVTEELAGAARFPFLAANLRRSGGRGPPPWVRPSLHRPELRLELVGLVTSEMEKLSSRRAREGLEFAPEAGALVAHAWAPGAARILVTHIGIERDRTLPLKGIAAVLGGHTHVAAVETLANGTILMHSGSHGVSIGRLELEIDPATGAVRSAKAEVVTLDGLRGDARIRDLIEGRTAEIRQAMAERVGRLAADLPRGGPEYDGISSPLGNHVADVVLEAARAEAAVILRSSIRASLFAGPVRRRDLYEATPFPDTIVAVTVTGARLRSALERAVGGDERILVEVAGIELGYDRSAPAGRRIGRLEVAGAPIDPRRRYRVATLSFMTEPGGTLTGGTDLLDTGRTVHNAHAELFRKRESFKPPEFRPRIVRNP